jgi:spore coat polysaccharide biosynthesis protein SpsF
MLELQIERIRRSLLIDEIIIATSTESRDDPIERLADKLRVPCFRGSEDDVLLRVVDTLKAFDVETHVEFLGDNPVPDPMLVDSIVGFYLKSAGEYDYVTNALKTTFPPGQEVYVYPAQALYDVESRVSDPALRENVGNNIEQRPHIYRIHNIEAPPWFNYPDLYMEVDTPEDFEVVSAIYEHFYPKNPGFGLHQVIEFMNANPDLASRNVHVERRWKALKQV